MGIKRARRARFYLGRAQSAIAKRGGALLSVGYQNAKSVLSVVCVNGHAFQTTYDRLQQGKWCRHCPRPNRYAYTIEDMRARARERGGECLSLEFSGIKSKLDWQCRRHGPFQASPSNVIHNGSWCPQCGREKSASSAGARMEGVQPLSSSPVSTVLMALGRDTT